MGDEKVEVQSRGRRLPQRVTRARRVNGLRQLRKEQIGGGAPERGWTGMEGYGGSVGLRLRHRQEAKKKEVKHTFIHS
jgi:hypothetical protein